MTIEQRAKEASPFLADQTCYIQGATEQQKIDIEKAWDFIAKHFDVTILDTNGTMGYGCHGITEEQFKKAMEDKV